MLICIPTLGRPLAQRTLHNVPQSIRDKIWLVIQPQEEPIYRGVHKNIIMLPQRDWGINTTRQYILEYALDNGFKKLLMLDDDLDFAVRREDEPTKFRRATDDDMVMLFAKIEAYLNAYAHVGVSIREGANYSTKRVHYASRMIRVLGYRTDVLKAEGVSFTPYVFMQDFGMTLELLTRGYPNAVINSFVQNQPSSNTKGGCSGKRTPEAMRKAAEYLQSRFPEFVTVVKKQTKTSWDGEERYDVRIQWKAAYGSAGTSRSPEPLDGGAGPDTWEEGERRAETVDD